MGEAAASPPTILSPVMKLGIVPKNDKKMLRSKYFHLHSLVSPNIRRLTLQIMGFEFEFQYNIVKNEG